MLQRLLRSFFLVLIQSGVNYAFNSLLCQWAKRALQARLYFQGYPWHPNFRQADECTGTWLSAVAVWELSSQQRFFTFPAGVWWFGVGQQTNWGQEGHIVTKESLLYNKLVPFQCRTALRATPKHMRSLTALPKLWLGPNIKTILMTILKCVFVFARWGLRGQTSRPLYGL